ncbi:fibronectin-like isoform X2 [Acanthaster planci]|uniref:Fibronectin-like isoform X2 n=1 Tax=Acanthaster planci TaxID=133434 RepID=A0A8B7XTL3_ACAPL|nr:fibronectin-like isoform X2 [Acanthaster planci]
MAILPYSASLVLYLSTFLLILAICEGRPQPPEFTSSFTSPTSIRVEWDDPILDPGAVVRGYRIQYKLGQNGKLIKLKLNARVGNSYDIDGLTESCGDYLIRMSTASSKGLSRYSSFNQVDRLLSGPQNLNAIPSSTSARVTWSPPSNGFCITGYQLKYGPNENELQSMDLPTELNQYLLSDLLPGTSYILTLAAVANGEISEEAYFQWYQAGPPSAPANLKATPSTTETAVVMWSPTSSSVTRYEYLYGPMGYSDSEVTAGYVGPSTTLVELSSLTPGEEYVFKVASVNSVGQSEPVTVTWTQPAPPPVVVPSKPIPAAPGQVDIEITSAETALITWTRPEGDVEITGYIVGFGLAGSDASELTLFSVGPDDTEEELDQLKPGSDYMVTIQAYNDVGDGEILAADWHQEAPSVPLSIPSPPQGVLSYSPSPNTIIVRWIITEEDAAEQIEGYRVTYGQDVSASDSSVEVGPLEESIEIQSLQPDTFYYIKVHKFNAAGRGESVSRSLQTLPPPPEERCAQQQQCIRQFNVSRSRGDGAICPQILQYLNCLQRLQDACIEDTGYRNRVNGIRNMFLMESCNRNSGRTPETGSPGPVRVPEVIPPPSQLSATVLSSTSALLSWYDETLESSQVVTDSRFYNVVYRTPLNQGYLEERTSETNYVVDFLLPGVPFEFSVQLVLDHQQRSEMSETITVTSRDPERGARPERFSVTQVTVTGPTSAKVILNWLPPPERTDVMQYKIEYTDSEEFLDPATTWDSLTVDGSEITASLEGLATDREYHVRITAIFSPTDIGPTLVTPATFATPAVPRLLKPLSSVMKQS